MFTFLTGDAIEAIVKIQRVWRRHYYRMIFMKMKRKIEEWNDELPKRIMCFFHPEELRIIQDLSGNFKIRFRFGGTEFPPLIHYKIYMDHQRVCLINSEKLFSPGTKASYESCEAMGKVNYYKQIQLQLDYKISHQHYDAMDVSNKLDFVKYLKSVDNAPAFLGGTSNSWRTLPNKYVMSSIGLKILTSTKNISFNQTLKYNSDIHTKMTRRGQCQDYKDYQFTNFEKKMKRYRQTPKLVIKDKNNTVSQRQAKLSQLQRLYGLLPQDGKDIEKDEDCAIRDNGEEQDSYLKSKTSILSSLSFVSDFSNEGDEEDSDEVDKNRDVETEESGGNAQDRQEEIISQENHNENTFEDDELNYQKRKSMLNSMRKHDYEGLEEDDDEFETLFKWTSNLPLMELI